LERCESLSNLFFVFGVRVALALVRVPSAEEEQLRANPSAALVLANVAADLVLVSRLSELETPQVYERRKQQREAVTAHHA
jgi:hypothetical protein